LAASLHFGNHVVPTVRQIEKGGHALFVRSSTTRSQGSTATGTTLTSAKAKLPPAAGSAVLPIVFVQVTNPVGGGFVASLAHPGGNITGFTNFEFAIGGKWLETLKEIAPDTRRVAVILNPENPTASGYLGAIEAMAPSLGVQVTPTAGRDVAAG
jgi:putative ABC transport system substrate-binding protein